MAKRAKVKRKMGEKNAKKSPGVVLTYWQQEIVVVFLLFMAVVLLFNPCILQNKVFSRGDDTAASHAWKRFINNHKEDLGRVPYWCPDVFIGFPSYSAGGYMGYHNAPNYNITKWINPMYYLTGITNLLYFKREFVSWLIALMFIAGLFTYLLLRGLGITRWVAVMLGLVMAWNPYFISLMTASHGGKLRTLIFIPLILLFTHRVMDRRRLIDIGLLGMAVGWLISMGAHAQVVYYAAIAIVVYFIVRTAFEWKDGTVKVAANTGCLLSAGVIGGLIGTLWTIPLYSYIPYSIRGMGPALAELGVKGLTLQWATGWSFHPFEIGTLAVPSLFGLKSPFYWGSMPFTSSSFYIGIVPLIFSRIALIYSRNRIVWFAAILSALVFFMSMGHHFMPLYKILFNILPGFNKFRTPSLIILVMQVAMIIMAGFGIQAVLSGKLGTGKKQPDAGRVFLILAGVCGGLLLFVLVLKSSLFGGLSSFMFSKIGDMSRYNTETLARLKQMRFNMFHRDLLIALLLSGLVFLFISLRIKGRLRNTGFLALLAILTVVDLWIISHNFFEPRPRATLQEPFQETQTISFVKQDDSIFRVLPLGEGFQDNIWMANGIQSVGGYQGAKMRRYQDILDYVLYKGPDIQFPLHHKLIDLLNAKYLISKGMLPGDEYQKVSVDPSTGMVVSINQDVLPRAFFVDTVWVRTDRKSSLDALLDPDWDPATIAIVKQEIPWEPGKGIRSARIISYGVEKVILQAEVSRPSLLVLADTHYPGNWHALIDGEETPIYLTDYLLRSVIVPEGEHEIRFFFRSRSIQAGITLSTLGYFLAALFLIVGVVWEWRKRSSKSGVE